MSTFLPFPAMDLLMNNYTGIQFFFSQLLLTGHSKSYRIAPVLLEQREDLERGCKCSLCRAPAPGLASA